MGLFVTGLFVKHHGSDKIIAKPSGERRKSMYLKKLLIVSVLFLALLQIPGLAQERRFNVKGEISFPKKGANIIRLSTKEEFESNKGSRFQSITGWAISSPAPRH
jgi:hypothetical protein